MNRREFITKTGLTAAGLAAAGPVSAVFAGGASMPSADGALWMPMLHVEGITPDPLTGAPLHIVECLPVGSLFDEEGSVTLSKAFQRIDSVVFEMNECHDRTIEIWPQHD